MSTLMKLVLSMVVLTWLGLMAASAIRSRGWGSRAILEALGNRDRPPAPSAVAGRADRAAANTLENFVLFAAIALVAQVSGLANGKVTLGAEIFCWARVAFIPIYILGIAYLRTVAWAIGLVGLCMMLTAMLKMVPS
jgi:uncharacterized MAPEG superfamily protein